MTLSPHREQNPILKYLVYFIALLLLAVTAWYFARPEPVHVRLIKVERGVVEATVSRI